MLKIFQVVLTLRKKAAHLLNFSALQDGQARELHVRTAAQIGQSAILLWMVVWHSGFTASLKSTTHVCLALYYHIFTHFDTKQRYRPRLSHPPFSPTRPELETWR